MGPTGATGPTGETGAPPEAETPAAAARAPSPPEIPPPPRLPATAEDARPGGSLAHSMGTWTADLFERNMQSVGRFVARQLIGTGADAVEVSLRVVGAIGYIVFALFLVLFFFFFFCTGYERVKGSLASLIPKWKKTRTLDMLRQMDEVIAGFVRGRLIIMAILMAVFTIGYWAIGVPAWLVLGPAVGILAIIPYAGLVSIPAAIALMWLQPVGPEWQQSWWWILLAPAVLYFFIQAIDDYVLTPTIQGKTTQMDTPTILFAVLAGGILAGFYGMILAVPTAACLKILWRETFWPRFKAWAEGRVKDFLPISRYDPTETGAPAAADAGAQPR
jgi:predicted PurR-regulated permease PerM